MCWSWCSWCSSPPSTGASAYSCSTIYTSVLCLSVLYSKIVHIMRYGCADNSVRNFKAKGYKFSDYILTRKLGLNKKILKGGLTSKVPASEVITKYLPWYKMGSILNPKRISFKSFGLKSTNQISTLRYKGFNWMFCSLIVLKFKVVYCTAHTHVQLVPTNEVCTGYNLTFRPMFVCQNISLEAYTTFNRAIRAISINHLAIGT